MREATENTSAGITIGGRKINNLRYADDTTLLCDSKEDLMELLTRIQQPSKEKGLLLNTRKTNQSINQSIVFYFATITYTT